MKAVVTKRFVSHKRVTAIRTLKRLLSQRRDAKAQEFLSKRIILCGFAALRLCVETNTPSRESRG